MKPISDKDARTIIKEAFHDHPPLPGKLESMAEYVVGHAAVAPDGIIMFQEGGGRQYGQFMVDKTYLTLNGRSFAALLGAAKNRKESDFTQSHIKENPHD